MKWPPLAPLVSALGSQLSELCWVKGCGAFRRWSSDRGNSSLRLGLKASEPGPISFFPPLLDPWCNVTGSLRLWLPCPKYDAFRLFWNCGPKQALLLCCFCQGFSQDNEESPESPTHLCCPSFTAVPPGKKRAQGGSAQTYSVSGRETGSVLGPDSSGTIQRQSWDKHCFSRLSTLARKPHQVQPVSSSFKGLCSTSSAPLRNARALCSHYPTPSPRALHNQCPWALEYEWLRRTQEPWEWSTASSSSVMRANCISPRATEIKVPCNLRQSTNKMYTWIFVYCFMVYKTLLHSRNHLTTTWAVNPVNDIIFIWQM